MSDLVSRIDSRIRQIQALLGEQVKPNGVTGGKKTAAGFGRELISSIAGIPHGSLPQIGGLSIDGLNGLSGTLEPFKPGTVKPIDAGLKHDPLSAILDAETGQKSGRSSEIGLLKSALEAYKNGPVPIKKEPELGPPR